MPSPSASSFTLAALALLLSACGTTDETIQQTGSGAALNGWVRHTDDVAGYSFHYPTRLDFSTDGTTALLRHEIAYEHPDPCDFRGDGIAIPSIVDFEVTMEMLEKSLRDAVIEKEGSDYVSQEYMNGDTFIVGGSSPVAAVNFRGLEGYQITSGVEGCGRYTYYFLSPSGRTFFVQRRFVPEFSALSPYAEQLRDLPGIIPPEQEELLFQRLMSTVSFRS